MNPAAYSALEDLRDGRPIEIRALRPTDEADMLLAIDRIGAEFAAAPLFCDQTWLLREGEGLLHEDRFRQSRCLGRPN